MAGPDECSKCHAPVRRVITEGARIRDLESPGPGLIDYIGEQFELLRASLAGRGSRETELMRGMFADGFEHGRTLAEATTTLGDRFDEQRELLKATLDRLAGLERLLQDQWAHRFDTAGEPDPHEVRAEALRSAARVMAPMTQSGAQNVIAIAKRFQAYIQDGV